MNVLIKKYYDQEGTYSEGVALVEMLAPNHLKLKMLKAGERILTKILLKQILKELETHQIKKPSSSTYDMPHDLQKQFNKVQQQRRILHNSYHDCETDEERKAINQQLRAIYTKYYELYRRVEHYRKTGELLPPKQAPTIAVELRHEEKLEPRLYIRIAQGTRSKWARELKKATAAKEKKKIIKAEGKLAIYTKKIELLQNIIDVQNAKNTQ